MARTKQCNNYGRTSIKFSFSTHKISLYRSLTAAVWGVCCKVLIDRIKTELLSTQGYQHIHTLRPHLPIRSPKNNNVHGILRALAVIWSTGWIHSKSLNETWKKTCKRKLCNVKHQSQHLDQIAPPELLLLLLVVVVIVVVVVGTSASVPLPVPVAAAEAVAVTTEAAAAAVLKVIIGFT